MIYSKKIPVKNVSTHSLTNLVYTFLHSLITLVSFLHVFTKFNFIFTCEYKLALRKFTRYIY